MPAGRRRSFFYNQRNRAGRVYDTRNVWTFHLWQHFVDMLEMELDMLGRWDLARHLDGQPLRFMMENRCALQVFSW